MPELLGGLCVDENHDLFFADEDEKYDRKHVLHAKRICKECPIQMQCLEIAMSDESIVGIWGGTTEANRKDLRRDLRRRKTIELRKSESIRSAEYLRRKKLNLPGKREESAQREILFLQTNLPIIRENEKPSVIRAIELRLEKPNAGLSELSFELGRSKGYMSHTIKDMLSKYK